MHGKNNSGPLTVCKQLSRSESRPLSCRYAGYNWTIPSSRKIMIIETNSRKPISRVVAAGILLVMLNVFTTPANAGIFDKIKEMLKTPEEQSEENPDITSEVSDSDQKLTNEDVGNGLKDALSVGIETVVSQLGAADGFNLDTAVHIPLPGSLDKVKSTLGKLGMSSTFDELELGLNRAAEVAVPKSRELLLLAVQDMTMEDVMEIYRGPDDAATQYFRSKMSEPLAIEMRPIVDESLSQVGAADTYGNIADSYNDLPFVSPVDSSLTDYVLEKGTDGIFYYLAQEEAAIRKNPVKRTTDLLKRLFKN